jgi:hypothetical protein
MEGSLVAYKVFTNGSVLQASEINDNLMRQSVMVFSNPAARNAAITSPVEGMLTWLEDVNRYESYNGTSWVMASPGIVLLNETAFSNSSLIRLNNVFSALYDDYLVKITITSASNTQVVNARYLTALDTPTTGNTYNRRGFFSTNATLSNYSGDSEPTFLVGATSGSTVSQSNTFINSPFLSTTTTARTETFDSAAGTVLYSTGNLETTARNFTGFQFSPTVSGITGKVRVYGFRNA